MKLDGATFLLQWATGGLLFGWVTTRRREVSLGYGWLVRIVFGVMALGAFALWLTQETTFARAVAEAAALATALAAACALAVSVQRRAAGVRWVEELRARRRARVAAMVGREADAPGDDQDDRDEEDEHELQRLVSRIEAPFAVVMLAEAASEEARTPDPERQSPQPHRADVRL